MTDILLKDIDPTLVERLARVAAANGWHPDESLRNVLEQAMIDAVKAAGATLLHIHLHTFGDGGGVSGVAVLSESHISVHTWPEREFAAFDIFMCGDARPEAAAKALQAALTPDRIVIGKHKRGIT